MLIEFLTAENIYALSDYELDELEAEILAGMWPAPLLLKRIGSKRDLFVEVWPATEVHDILSGKRAGLKKSKRRKLAELISNRRNGCGVSK